MSVNPALRPDDKTSEPPDWLERRLLFVVCAIVSIRVANAV